MSDVVDGEYSGELYDDLSSNQLFGRFIWLAIEATPSRLNTYFSLDGDVWTRTCYRRRPDVFSGAPNKIILGKGYGTGKNPYQAPDLDNDSPALGKQDLTLIDEFLVTKDEILVEGPFVRKFPYPYKAGLAIASDVDGMSRKEFLAIHQFVNTKENTSLNPNRANIVGMGNGVGLEIAASFWMFSDNDGSSVSDGMSYFRFDGSDATRSEDADLIRTYFHAGYIDCIHSFGHFGRTGGFTRQLGITALDEMVRAQILPIVWSNHGDGYDLSNIGHVWNPMNMGDLPGSGAYHTDRSVVPDGPIRFLWNYNADGLVDYPVASLLTDAELSDSKKILTFRRFYGPGWLPENFGDQLALQTLDGLVATEGYMIVANHLAARGWPTPVFMDSNAIEALRRLEIMHRSGEIYVTTTSSLLWYDFVRRNIEWNWGGDPASAVTINIEKVTDPIGPDFVPELRDLRGLTFCIPFSGSVRVMLSDEDITNRLESNDADYLGVRSLSVPLVRLPPFPEWISDGYTYKTEDYEVPEYEYTIDVTNIDAKAFAPTLSYVGLHSFAIQEVREEDLYHIWVSDSARVHLPLLAAGEAIESLRILNGQYRSDLPRLAKVAGDSIMIEQATYDSDQGSTLIIASGQGSASLTFVGLSSPFLGEVCSFRADGAQTVTAMLEGRRSLKTVDMHVEPAAGAIDIITDTWNTTGDHYKRWLQEQHEVTSAVAYKICDLTPCMSYVVKANGLVLGSYMSGESGCVGFTYNGSEPSVLFEVTDLTDPERSEFWLTGMSPNPFVPSAQRSAACVFALPGTGQASVRVLDAKGRLVAVLLDATVEPGVHIAEWDGTDRGGKPAPSGVYFIGLEACGRVGRSKLLLLR